MRIGKQWIFAGLVLALGVSLSAAAAPKNPGATLYKEKCAMCHGMDGKGLEPMHTPDFTSPAWQKDHSDQYIVHTIKDGKKGTMMLAFGSKLSSAQIQDLLHYIRSLNSAKK